MAIRLDKLVHILIGVTVLIQGTVGLYINISPSPTATVIENDSTTLTCSGPCPSNKIVEWWLNDATTATLLLIWNAAACTFANGDTTMMFSCRSVQEACEMSMTLKQVKNSQHGDKWNCVLGGIASRKTNILVNVPITSVQLTSPATPQTSIVENVPYSYLCETSAGRPQASVQWYKRLDSGTEELIEGGTVTTESSGTLIITKSSLEYGATKSDDGYEIYCKASSSGSATLTSSRKPVFDVLHAPLINILPDRSVVLLSPLILQCPTTPGNPPETSYRWTRSTDNWSQSGQTMSISSVQKTDTGDYTCTAWNVMTPTQGSHVNGEDTETFTLDVLYAPLINILRDRSVVLLSPLILQCPTTPGNPPETSYRWTRSTDNWSQSGQTMSISSVQKTDTGDYTCTAWNVMTPTQGSHVNGEDTETFTLDVLYAPLINILPDRSVVLLSPLILQCPTTPGNPPETSYRWTRSTDNWSQSGQTMSISSVQKTDTGDYTCTAWNVMTPTEGSHVNGEDAETFTLDVLYKTSITSFILSEKSGSTIYTVDENSTKTFQCQVDSNPASEITLKRIGGSQLVHKSNTQFVTFTGTLGCHDAGMYVCTGHNTYNGDERPTKELQLVVRCAPRPSVDMDHIKTIYKAIYEEVTLRLTVTAYPKPVFTWFIENKCNISEWSQIHTGILSDDIMSSMTIKRLQQTDFRQYKLVVSNGITPDFVQLFTISEIARHAEQFTPKWTDPNVTALVVGVSTASLVFGAALTLAMLFLLRYFEIVQLERRKHSKNTSPSPNQFEKRTTGSYGDSGETSAAEEEDPEEVHQYEGLGDINRPVQAYESLRMESLPTSLVTTLGEDKGNTYINLTV